MPIELTHQNVRDLSKKLREITGRDIKHTEIIAAIAEAVGRRSDAMMHELKNEKVEIARPNTAEASEKLVTEAGFEVWTMGGGCEAFAQLLKEKDAPNGDVCTLDVMITTASGTSVDAGPMSPVWEVGINYQDPRGGEGVLGGGEGLTLHEAIASALVLMKEADRLWEENYDEAAIEAFLSKRAAPRA